MTLRTVIWEPMQCQYVSLYCVVSLSVADWASQAGTTQRERAAVSTGESVILDNISQSYTLTLTALLAANRILAI